VRRRGERLLRRDKAGCDADGKTECDPDDAQRKDPSETVDG
jgi:hypothetical protein